MLAVRLLLLSILIVLSGCATKKTTIDGIADLPPTAASGDTELNTHVWTGVGGKPVRNLVKHTQFPHQPTSIERITTLDLPDQRGDKYGQRISGLLQVDTSGSYQFWGSGDESFEIWISVDELPENKRLIAYANKPTGYKVWDRYSTQKSMDISLDAGERYYFEVLHKEYTGADYVSVFWMGPNFELTPLTEEHLRPMGMADTVSGETAFKEGYHTGYTAGSYLAKYDDSYPIVDDDGDGLPNFYELLVGLDPQDITDAYSDVDGDLLSAYEEYQILTNPSDADSDSDGVPDGFEYVYGMNPLDSADAHLDLDGDGMSNIDEYVAGTAPDDQADFVEPPPMTTVVTLNWDAPNTMEDGSILDSSEIKSYRVYSGPSAEELVAIGETNQLSVQYELEQGVYFYALSTLLMDGRESKRSGVITISVGADGNVSSTYDSSSEEVSSDEPVIEDSDNDGMSDEFELLYGFDPLDPSDATLDSDLDGVSNVDEFLAGTDPVTNESRSAGPVLVTLTWVLPSSREDGSVLTLSEIQSYRIYSGSSSSSLNNVTEISDPSQNSWSEEFPQGTYYFAISTVTTDGVEGARSPVQGLTTQ